MIQKLDQNLINKIAAGEVVERPASVVKELLENSIDAQADRIELEIKDAGFELIKVKDNGIGIDKNDIELTIEQHATSKIKTLNDLYSVESLGFRGEALASISSVAKFRIISKTKESISGTELEFINNQKNINPIGSTDGTTVIVEQLFYNVPARKNFLKAKSTEFNHISDVFVRNSLIFPQISFVLVHNGKIIHNLMKTDSWKTRIKDLFGPEVANNVSVIDFSVSDFKIKGYLGQPSLARNNRKKQFLFINKRPVNDFLINKAVKDAYRGLILGNEFPFFIINIQIPNETVDVNVHPRKMEVKFQNSGQLYSQIYRAVSDFLDNSQISNTLNQINRVSEHQNHFSQPSTKIFDQKPQSFSFKPQSKPNFINFEQKQDTVTEWKVFGQINNSYLVCEHENRLYIIDQHAASEITQYRKLKKQWFQQKIVSQQLLMPLTIDFNHNEKHIFDENKQYFEKIGFSIDDFGQNSVNVNAVPQDIAKKDIKKIILELTDEFSDYVNINIYEEKVDNILKSLACKSAVRFGDYLRPEEINALINLWTNTENNTNCPHGRPVYIEYSMDNLKKLFKR